MHRKQTRVMNPLLLMAVLLLPNALVACGNDSLTDQIADIDANTLPSEICESGPVLQELDSKLDRLRQELGRHLDEWRDGKHLSRQMEWRTEREDLEHEIQATQEAWFKAIEAVRQENTRSMFEPDDWEPPCPTVDQIILP